MHNIEEEEKEELIDSEEEDFSTSKDPQLDLADPSHSDLKGKFKTI